MPPWIRRALAWPVAGLLSLAVAAPATAAPTATVHRTVHRTAARAATGSLEVTPQAFYGGQAVRFSGRLGRTSRPVWLEFNMNRPGDRWTRIPGSEHRTDSQGRFSFRFPARGMLNISLRVAAAGRATHGLLFQARNQAVALSMTPDAPGTYDGGACGLTPSPALRYPVPAGEGATITVDSTPHGEPVLAGRPVTLQRRSGITWTTVGRGRLDAAGQAAFHVAGTAGDPVAYRAVLGSVTDHGDRIGWYPSFPTYLQPEQRPAAPGAASPSLVGSLRLLLSWTLPADPARDAVVVAWDDDGTPPVGAADADHVKVLPADTLSTTLTGLRLALASGVSVLTRAADGLCSVAASARPPSLDRPATSPAAGPPARQDAGLGAPLPVVRATTAARGGTGATPTAAGRGGWGASLFDFAFEYGESLTDRPERGTVRQGSWEDTSTGSGAAMRHNGGLLIQSKYGTVSAADAGDGDLGTTSVTLRHAAATSGRWEVRMAAWTQRDTGEPYDLRFALVPADAAPTSCAGPSITLADFTPVQDRVTLAARAADGTTWGRTLSGVRLGERGDFHTFAAELEPDHVTWFLDGRAVATLGRSAVPDRPMTLRVSMIGDGQAEMQTSYVIMDWVRGYRADTGHPTESGTALAKGSGSGAAATSC